jgi:hypothetical protein
MTVEGRLEALTQSLELVASMQLKTEQEIAKTQVQIRRLGRYVRAIVVDHEQRLAALEGDEEEDLA